jgi:hypothetical protein
VFGTEIGSVVVLVKKKKKVVNLVNALLRRMAAASRVFAGSCKYDFATSMTRSRIVVLSALESNVERSNGIKIITDSHNKRI